ncbi:MAG: hypothetical protein Q8927_04400 [Bacteroidota bacterium]|nr:hypothetical protein [Bacteroidota bacterium]MDP4215418.1 hypothetical protein [Bacteroidota bacterium]MDP4245906.1 hypothetical protein [Bacteroidota bacterium]MDP4254396.1 hypothetical protein [Bacteroidota bacterium]MDP4256739.1 hypothetical protein [Bacteroidota bacterium]
MQIFINSLRHKRLYLLPSGFPPYSTSTAAFKRPLLFIRGSHRV